MANTLFSVTCFSHLVKIYPHCLVSRILLSLPVFIRILASLVIRASQISYRRWMTYPRPSCESGLLNHLAAMLTLDTMLLVIESPKGSPNAQNLRIWLYSEVGPWTGEMELNSVVKRTGFSFRRPGFNSLRTPTWWPLGALGIHVIHWYTCRQNIYLYISK